MLVTSLPDPSLLVDPFVNTSSKLKAPAMPMVKKSVWMVR